MNTVLYIIVSYTALCFILLLLTYLSDPVDCFPDSVVPFPGFVDFVLEALTLFHTKII